MVGLSYLRHFGTYALHSNYLESYTISCLILKLLMSHYAHEQGYCETVFYILLELLS